MSNVNCCADGEIDFGKESIQEFDPESMAWLTYSSGTTGIPKTIVHPYKNISKLVTFYRCVIGNFNILYISIENCGFKVLAIFYYRNKFCPQRKFLFMNNMFYMSGIFMCVTTAVSHTQSYTLSNYSEESFLAAIDEVKVSLCCPISDLNLVEHEFYSIPNSPIKLAVSPCNCLGCANILTWTNTT